MSVGVRYAHKWLDRTIEDVGIHVPGVGEVFFIANPGFGMAEQILPAAGARRCRRRSATTTASSSAYASACANRWSMNTSYLWSRLVRQLRRSGQLGRERPHVPNVDRYFDGLYMLFDAHGEPVYGLLPTDRPHYLKAQMTYDTAVGHQRRR